MSADMSELATRKHRIRIASSSKLTRNVKCKEDGQSKYYFLVRFWSPQPRSLRRRRRWQGRVPSPHLLPCLTEKYIRWVNLNGR